MTSVSGPATAETGKQITVAGTVMNRGPLERSLFRRLLLSADAQITNKDTFLGSAPISSFGPGVEQTVSFAGNVPANLPGDLLPRGGG